MTFEKNTFCDAGPLDTKYLYYPHVEGVSLLAANITQNKQPFLRNNNKLEQLYDFYFFAK